MYTPSITQTRPWPYGAHAAPTSLRAGVADLVAALGRKYRARRAVHELMALDDRMLRDVGLGRAEIEHAVQSGRDPG
jgi:uncharacterized protein YjiS (DUF1127 family)